MFYICSIKLWEIHTPGTSHFWNLSLLQALFWKKVQGVIPMTKLVITLAALAAFSPIAHAEYYSTPFGPVYTTMSECRMASAMPDMRQLDGNRDGLISSREFELNGSGDTTVSMFYSIDKNKDAIISGRELDAYRNIGKCRESR